MPTRSATCSCGQLRVEVPDEPIRVSICHCLACQRRTGSAFGVQARFASDRVRVAGRFSEYVRLSDDDGQERVSRFCPDCGATVFFTIADDPDMTAVPVGAFADPDFPPPTISFYESRRHAWVGLPDGVERDDAWEAVRPLYAAGEYALAADRGRDLIEAYPEHPGLLYNVACCESLAGRTEDAIEHLRRAIERSGELRSLAETDSDFDPIRDQPAFRQLLR